MEFKTKIDKQITAFEYWIDDITDELLYGGAKGGGKSYLGAALIFSDALTYPGTHYFIARQELIDLRKYTVPTIQEVFKNWGLDINIYAKFDGQYNVYTLYNGSKVFLIACKEQPSDPMFERFGSIQMTRGWIEEGGEVSESAKSNLWLSIGRWKNDEYKLKKKLLITANPKKGWMKREFVEPFKQGILPINKRYIQAFATDNFYLPEDYIATLSGEKDKVRRQRLFEGNWDYDEDMDSLVSYDALSDLFSNTIVKDNEKYLIIDVARFGEDTTTFNYWEGLGLYKIKQFSKQDTHNTIQKAKDEAAIEKIPWSNILIDEDGIGGAIVDGMPGVKGFVANSTPLPTANEIRTKLVRVELDFLPKRNFYNLKSQCAFKVAELINEHKISISVPEYREVIIEDLTALLRHKQVDSDRKLAIKPKDEVKQDLGRSPDIGDPIIYRAWFELRREALDENPNINQIADKQKFKFVLNRRNIRQNSNE